MSQALQNLLNLLNLEKLEEGLYRGQSEDLGLRQVFGGQVVGQALYAAKQTVPPDRVIHSFHSYFLRPGDSQKAIIYDVETLRDGKSFSARRVSAIQNGQPIFYMTASFQSPESGFEHQNPMPEVVGPENLLTEQAMAQKMAHLLPEKLREKFIAERPLEIRPVQIHNPLRGHVAKPERQVWIRATGPLPYDLRIHQYLLGYASDLNFHSCLPSNQSARRVLPVCSFCEGILRGRKWWGPCQLHPGTRVTCYGCFLPDLTEFTS